MLKRFLLEKWTEFIGTSVPSSMDLVSITSCTLDYGNNIVLVFVNEEENPSYVVKICRNPAYGFKLKREYAALRALRNKEDLKSYVPTPYFLGEYHGCTFFLMDGVLGFSLFKLVRRYGLNKSNSALIEQAIDLLVHINHSAQEVLTEDVLFGRNTQNVFSRFESEFFEAGMNRPKISELREFYRQADNYTSSLFMHGDYWQTNIIVDVKKKKITGIIDWEFCSAGSSAPTDIIWFLINLAYCLYVKTNPLATVFDSYKWGFFNPGKHNEIFTSYYHKYMSSIHLNFKSLKSLIEVTLAEMAMRELATYGRHSNMDTVCLKMLKYTIQNEKVLCIG